MTNSIIIPSDPKTQQAIRNCVKQMSDSMTRIKAEQEHQAQMLLDMKEKTDIKGSMLRQLAKVYYQANIDEVRTKNEDFDALYEVVLMKDASND